MLSETAIEANVEPREFGFELCPKGACNGY